MSTETITPQEQSQTDTGLDRLSKDPAFLFDDEKPIVKPTETAAVETSKLEGDTPVETPPPPVETPPVEPIIEEGFKDEEQIAETSDSWKAYLEANNIPIPEDFAEEKGFDIVMAAKETEKLAAIEEVRAIKEVELFTTLPEQTRAEAQLIVDLLKTGQTLEQINQPFQQIKEWKSMPKEQLIREGYAGKQGWTEEMVDHKMQQIEADKTLDIEYKIVLANVEQLEQSFTAQRQQQIEHYQTLQTQKIEQKRSQELTSIKAALDKMPTFMDRKLSEDNKQSVLRDIDLFDKASPTDKAEFMLWKKYGKQGLKDLQARVTEKATLEKAKTQHNVPIAQSGGNRQGASTTYKDGLDRLSNDPAFA